MAAMTSAVDLRSVTGWFRLVALLEAVSWVGLLAGMYFKYLAGSKTEVGVKIFGMAHGLVFVAFVGLGLLAGMALRWGTGTWLLALLGSIVPLGSVIFLIWADRTGRMGVSGAAAVVARPGRRAADTTCQT
ncbi:DUF3817 domain-containing protein [Mycolicibacterium sp. XJ1819]